MKVYHAIRIWVSIKTSLWSLVRDTIAYVLERTTLDDLLLNKISLLEGDDLVVFKQ
jgi:hypothetical protein